MWFVSGIWLIFVARKKILDVLRLIYCYNDVLSLISGLMGVLRLTLLFFSFKPSA